MANYDVPANPTYVTAIRKLEDTDPASASAIFNPLIQQLITNIHAVKKFIDGLNDSIEGELKRCIMLDASGKVPDNMLSVINTITGIKGDSESAYRTGNVNLTAANVGALSSSGGTITGNLTVNGTVTGSKVYNAVWSADYAEGFEYEGDTPEPGEIMELCGNNKVRLASAESNMVIGVCSDTYWALAGCAIADIENKTKVAVGIAGQLPIKVRGAVKYGDYIVCVGNGIGEARSDPIVGHVVGRAMENNSASEIKRVNCLIQVR